MVFGHACASAGVHVRIASYLHADPTTAVSAIVPEPEPSKRIHRMVELSRQAGMAEADITKVWCVSEVNRWDRFPSAVSIFGLLLYIARAKSGSSASRFKGRLSIVVPAVRELRATKVTSATE